MQKVCDGLHYGCTMDASLVLLVLKIIVEVAEVQFVSIVIQHTLGGTVY